MLQVILKPHQDKNKEEAFLDVISRESFTENDLHL